MARTFTIVVSKAEQGGYTAKCLEIPQVHTEGETMDEVLGNTRDALRLALEYLKEKTRAETGQVMEITI